MKKLLVILVMVLLWCDVSFANNIKVVDGDTIILNDEKIRFSGIDAPELKQICMLQLKIYKNMLPIKILHLIINQHYISYPTVYCVTLFPPSILRWCYGK